MTTYTTGAEMTAITTHRRITATVNEYGGEDFRVFALDGACTGLVRTDLDDGHLTVRVFESGAGIETWSATFSTASGDNSSWLAIVATINAALATALAR